MGSNSHSTAVCIFQNTNKTFNRRACLVFEQHFEIELRMKHFNIFIIGVGGQGIGLLSETIARAADYSGFPSYGTDTHGLAQRGGTVTSHIRIGTEAHSAIIQRNRADMVIGLERHEALRGMNDYLKDDGVLVFYNVSLQPLTVRLGQAISTPTSTIYEEAKKRNIKVVEVFEESLSSEKLQNIAVMANIAKLELIPDISKENFLKALNDLMKGSLLEMNQSLMLKIMETI